MMINLNFFFLDDNKSLWGGTIDGISVKPVSVLDNLKSNLKPNELWLTIDNLPQYKKH